MPCPCILKSGDRKGQKCGRAITTGRFCGVHKKCKQQPGQSLVKEYETEKTEWNGGTPFIVRDYGNKVKVYEPTWSQYELVVGKYVMDIPYVKKFTMGSGDWERPFDGFITTILLKISTKEYILIAGEGTISKIKTKEEIKEFFSPGGPNGIPYPYAISDNYLYDLSDFSIYNKKKLPTQVLQKKVHVLDANVKSVGQIPIKIIYSRY